MSCSSHSPSLLTPITGWPSQDNVLKNAPHTAQSVLGDKWEHPYSRESVRFRRWKCYDTLQQCSRVPNCAGQSSCCVSEQKSTMASAVEQAAFPAAWVKQAKFWPSVARVDDVYGDRQLIARWVRWAHAASAVTDCCRGLASASHCMTLEK